MYILSRRHRLLEIERKLLACRLPDLHFSLLDMDGHTSTYVSEIWLKGLLAVQPGDRRLLPCSEMRCHKVIVGLPPLTLIAASPQPLAHPGPFVYFGTDPRRLEVLSF